MWATGGPGAPRTCGMAGRAGKRRRGAPAAPPARPAAAVRRVPHSSLYEPMSVWALWGGGAALAGAPNWAAIVWRRAATADCHRASRSPALPAVRCRGSMCRLGRARPGACSPPPLTLHRLMAIEVQRGPPPPCTIRRTVGRRAPMLPSARRASAPQSGRVWPWPRAFRSSLPSRRSPLSGAAAKPKAAPRRRASQVSLPPVWRPRLQQPLASPPAAPVDIPAGVGAPLQLRALQSTNLVFFSRGHFKAPSSETPRAA